MEKLITGAEYQSATPVRNQDSISFPMTMSISVSQFAENFRRIWLTTGKVVNGRKTLQDGPFGLPRKLGKTRLYGKRGIKMTTANY